jgi:SAM-dependent methyltransferase
MTVELAEHVAPGEVVGMDPEPRALEQARDLAETKRVHNIRFDQGDVYGLAYADASFDVLFSHALTVHLREPVRALAEMRRVLKPGGIAAVVESEPWHVRRFTHRLSCGAVLGPVRTRATLQQWGSTRGSAFVRSALIEAGFERTEGYAGSETLGTPDQAAVMFATVASSPEFARTVSEQGWATEGEMIELPQALLDSGERPDGFFAVLKCGALGWAHS